MKPKPLFVLKNFTVPVVIIDILLIDKVSFALDEPSNTKWIDNEKEDRMGASSAKNNVRQQDRLSQYISITRFLQGRPRKMADFQNIEGGMADVFVQ